MVHVNNDVAVTKLIMDWKKAQMVRRIVASQTIQQLFINVLIKSEASWKFSKTS